MKYLLPFLIIFLGLAVAYGAFAISKDDIVYPIAELENCENEAACFAYCNDPAHLDECLAFAELHNLFSADEIAKAKKFQEIGAVGPGGCTTEQECKAYCENVNNIEECLAFAEQHGFMDPEELEEAKKIAAALRAGAQLPGGCTSEAECEAYCEDPNNMRECIAFAEAAGFMSPQELREVKQVLKALDAGIPFPGNCRGQDECEAYCEDPNHIEECVEFGIAAGFIPPEEVDAVRRMIPLMKEGKMPEGCRGGREECEAYCADEANTEECTIFFVEAGFMTAEEAEMFKKTGGRGPGDCKGRDECEAFCNNPANQEVCFEFGREHGFISEEEFHNIEEGTRQFEEGFAVAPPEVEQCLREKLGENVLLKIEAGTFLPTPELGEHMRYCFEEFFPGPEGGEFGPPPGFEGGFEGDFSSKSPEQIACIERILGTLDNPRSPEQEERIARECFGTDDFFGPQDGQHFEGEDVQGGFQQQFQQEFERQFQEQQQQQLEQFQQLIPQIPQIQGGSLLPEDILRQEQEEAALRLKLEQELQQQFQQLEQLQQQEPPATEDAAQGNILDAVGRFLQQLLFGR